MRIIGGELSGRRIQPPAKMPNTRPTTDIAKEGLFNILENNLSIPGMKTLDLFGGTGSISYELASRGAVDLSVVEMDRKMTEFIKNTSAKLGLDKIIRLYKSDVFRYIENCTEKFDFIFAGPPYALKNIDDLPRLVFEKNILHIKGWFVLEHTPRNNYKSFPYYVTERNYGTTVFSVFIETRN